MGETICSWCRHGNCPSRLRNSKNGRLHRESGLAGRVAGRHPGAMAFSAVLFDFDGVLVDTEWAIYQAWLRTFRAHGHELPLEVYTRCIGSDFATWSPKTHLEELSGLDFDWHDIDSRRQEDILRELSGEGVLPGVIGLLEKLTRHGIRRAVVS